MADLEVVGAVAEAEIHAHLARQRIVFHNGHCIVCEQKHFHLLEHEIPF
jgi:hypothetical protein